MLDAKNDVNCKLMTHTTKNNKNQNKNKNNQQTKQKKMEIDIQIPKKIKTGTPKSIGLNQSSNFKFGPEKLHTVEFDASKNKLRVKGHSLLCYASVPSAYALPNTTGYLWRRIFIHPSLIFSRKLAYLGKMYAKYKFIKLKASFLSTRPATASGTIHLAYNKDYSCAQPNPGVSTLAWMSEMDGYRQCKIWESVDLPVASTLGDLPSYSMDRSETDISTVYQNSLLIAVSGLDAVVLGEVYLDYEVEFDVMNAPPANFTDYAGYTAYSGNIIDGVLKWRTTDAGQIAFWGPRAGVYYCTQMAPYTCFNNTAEFAARNFAGMPFILSVQGVQTTGWTGSYTAIEFEIYDSMAGLLDNNHVETGATTTGENIIFEGTQILSTAAPIVESVNPLQVVEGDNQTNPQSSNTLCGISVGPGVIAGIPDITPHLGMDHGRIHLGVNNPLSKRR